MKIILVLQSSAIVSSHSNTFALLCLGKIWLKKKENEKKSKTN